jgi:hypothetical protein
MATSPQFAATPRIGLAQVSAANTNRDGTGTVVTVLTGASAGTRINEVVVDAAVSTSAGMVRIYLHDGTSARLFDEFPIASTSASASVPTARVARTYDNLVLPSASWSLRASTHNAEAINVIALGADL